MLVSSRMLESQLDWMGRNFRFVTLDEVGARLEQGEPFNEPVAAVTFDDGYQDVYEQACPILLRKGIPATFFVVTDLVGQASWQVFDRLYRVLKHSFPEWAEPSQRSREALAAVGVTGDAAIEIGGAPGPEAATGQILNRTAQADVLDVIEALESWRGRLDEGIPPLLTWDTIRDMRRSGFTIASHTRTHVWLPREAPERVATELAGSRLELERQLGEPVAHFAYPAGEFTGDVVAAVQVAGYRFGYTICGHRDRRRPLLTVPRELLWEHSATDGRGRFSPAQMSCHIHGLFSGMNGCVQTH